MAKIEIVIAIEEPEIYYPIVLELLQIYDDEIINIYVTTNQNSLSLLLEKKMDVDVLLADEIIYRQIISIQSIQQTILLTEKDEVSTSASDGIIRIYKYTKLQSIKNVILSNIKDRTVSTQNLLKNTSLILVSSVAGGVGKTVVALSVTRELNRNHKKALYFNTDMLQDYSSYIGCQNTLNQDVQKTLILSDGYAGEAIINEISTKDGINYIPQMELPLISYNKDKKFYLNIIKDIKDSNRYEYIVIDSDHVFDQFKTDLIQLSDLLIMISDTSIQDNIKYEKIISGVIFRNTPKMIYNKKNENDGKDHYFNEHSWDAVIPTIEGTSKNVIHGICANNSFKEMIYMIL